MSVFEGSRYEDADTELVVGTDGKPREVLKFLPPLSFTFDYINYTVRQGDRIDVLGQRFYGDPELWWAIAQVNPQWTFWDVLPAGLVLRVPRA